MYTINFDISTRMGAILLLFALVQRVISQENIEDMPELPGPPDPSVYSTVDPNDFDVVMFETHTKRILQASNTTSTAAGNGTVGIEPFKKYTVTVTARNSGNSLRGTGGDSFYVMIQNECTYSNQTTCTQVGGAANTITTPFEGLMSYNGDSTYSYNYTLNTTGRISLTVILRNTGRVMNAWYSDHYLRYGAYSTNETTQISYNWGSGVICCGSQSNYVSATFSTYLRPNVSGSYSLYTNCDGGANLDLDGTRYLSNFNGATGVRGFTITLTEDTNYYIHIQWLETTGTAYCHLQWIIPGTSSRVTVPAVNQVWPEFVTSTPFTFDIGCAAGYTHTNASHPTECYPICGDGLRLGAEICDDNNQNSGDGCASDCLSVEFNCTCDGGSATTTDTCFCRTPKVENVEEYSTATKVMMFAGAGAVASVAVAAVVVTVIVELRQPIQYSRIQQNTNRIRARTKAKADKNIETERKRRSGRYEL